ncbi:MAG: Ldh family oxidoreductase [Candidatus Handelsmanbacteria bacterium]|nr:Ldh family oxidoreductase [Candidatus Handelsmanbacteria bacterium]
MNRPPEHFVRVPDEQLRSFAAACLKAAGMPEDHAEQLAQLLTNSDLRGVRSHGVRTIGGYCPSLKSGRVNPRPEIKILRETDTYIYIDGGGGLGYAPTMLATEKAIAKAKAKGVAIGAACRLGHYGSAGHYVHRALEEGCFAFSVQGSYPQYYVSNKDKRAASYGNPPLCFGLPGLEGPPLVLDGATCILADYQRGPEFEALEAMIPAAFFKSMGYTGIATALGGVFVGQGQEESRAAAERWHGARMGSLVWVMDLGLFAPAAQVRAGVDTLINLVREEMTPLQGYGEATLPGTVEWRKTQEYRREGIPMSSEDLERLHKTGEDLGVDAPWA